MVQKKKLKRVDIGSVEAQRARGAKITSPDFVPTAKAHSRPNFPNVAAAQQKKAGFEFRQGFKGTQGLAQGQAPAQEQQQGKENVFQSDRGLMDNLGRGFRELVSGDPKELSPEAPTGLDLALTATMLGKVGKTVVGKAEKAAAGQLPRVVNKVGSAYRIATNSLTLGKTLSYLEKIAVTLKQPKYVAANILGIIGSYPFAGFIKEEALQDMGFAVTIALENDNIEGAEEALAATAEILNPGMWEQIISGVPYANVVAELKDYVKGAAIKWKINRDATNKKIIALETKAESQFLQDTRTAEEIKTKGAAERNKAFNAGKEKDPSKVIDFQPPSNAFEASEQANFQRRAQQ